MDTFPQCPKCGYHCGTIKIFVRDPKTNKPYIVTRCLREECNYNYDIEPYTPENRAKSHPRELPDRGNFSKWD